MQNELKPREDYTEMAKLCLIILCEQPSQMPIHFRLPGANHMAACVANFI